MVTEERTGVAAFCQAEHARLAAVMTLHTGDPDLGRELAQEALARVVARWAYVQRLDSPSAWAYRVAFNLANSHFRRRRYERLSRARVAARLVPTWSDPDHAHASAVRDAVLALPPRQRQAVILRYLMDLSIDDTAERMNCAAGTVRALTSQGLSRLRRNPVLSSSEVFDD